MVPVQTRASTALPPRGEDVKARRSKQRETDLLAGAKRAPKPPLASISVTYALGYGLGWEYRQMGGSDLTAALGACPDPEERRGFRDAFSDLEGLT
jgi:hypothetical protein